MYNAKQIEPFFKKVHKEATEAAQKVYDKYNDECITRIMNQMGEGHLLHNAMGVCCVQGTHNDDHINLWNPFFEIVGDHTQYWNKVEAGFNIPYKIEKH